MNFMKALHEFNWLEVIVEVTISGIIQFIIFRLSTKDLHKEIKKDLKEIKELKDLVKRHFE